MTKADLAALVAEKGLTKKQAMDAVEATLDILKTTLQTGEKIQLTGFGSFQIRAKRARRGRNPQTGEEITITARKVLKFKPGKELHASVNQQAASNDAVPPPSAWGAGRDNPDGSAP